MNNGANPYTSLDVTNTSECLESGEGIRFLNILIICVSKNNFLELFIHVLLITCALIIAGNDTISDMAHDMIILDTLSLESIALFETISIVYITLLLTYLLTIDKNSRTYSTTITTPRCHNRAKGNI